MFAHPVRLVEAEKEKSKKYISAAKFVFIQNECD